jgi:type I restriction enzyme S subunit
VSLGTTIQLRHLFDVVSGSTPESGNADYWDGEIPWVTPEDVSKVEGNVLRETRRKLTAEGFANSGTTMVAAGGIVLTKRAPIGQLALLGLDACSNQGCFLLTPREGIEPRFFYYVLENSVPSLQALGRGSTFMELSTDDLKALRAPVLHRPQQLAIADFLDRETAQIDALVAAKQRLIDLLAEKRKTVIATAVTRGLDPKATLRDSGVPWLGEIPAHWEMRRMKYLFRLVADRAPEGNDYQLLSLYTDIGVKPRRELEERGNKATTTDDYWLVEPGDLIVNKLLAWMGAFGVSKYEGVTSPAYDILRPQAHVESVFYHHLFRCGIASTEVRARSYGIMDMRLRLYFDRLGDMAVPLPPHGEQCAIVEYITRETARVDAVRAATERTIALLKERRSALIAAAVTGQIDVGTAA